MDKYFKIDDLAKWLKDESDSYSMKDIAPIGWTLIGLINELSKIPTADVVEVVRCKDCENYIDSRCYSLHRGLNDWTSKEDYCSNGKRRIERRRRCMTNL